MKYSLFVKDARSALALLEVLQNWAVYAAIVFNQKKLPAEGVNGFGFIADIDTRRLSVKVFETGLTKLKEGGVDVQRM